MTIQNVIPMQSFTSYLFLKLNYFSVKDFTNVITPDFIAEFCKIAIQ